MAKLPDAFIAAGDLHLKGRGRRESRQEAQAQTVSQLPPKQQGLQLAGIEVQGVRENRHSQEVFAEPDWSGAEFCRVGYKRGKRQALSSIPLNILGDNLQVRRDSVPQSAGITNRVQAVEVNLTGIQQPGVVYDVAQTDVEVAIHALESADDDAVFGSEDTEVSTINRDDSCARQQELCEGGLLTGLTKALDVDFDHFWQSGDNEVPLIRQTVSPAALGQLPAKLRTHDLHNLRGISIGVKIEIASEVWPVIQRFDDGYGASILLESRANRIEILECTFNSKTFLLQCGGHTLSSIVVASSCEHRLEQPECTDNDVIAYRQRLEGVKLFGTMVACDVSQMT